MWHAWPLEDLGVLRQQWNRGFKETKWDSVDCKHLAQDKDKFRAHVCEYGNDISGSIPCEKFNDEVRNSQFPKKEPDPWSYFSSPRSSKSKRTILKKPCVDFLKCSFLTVRFWHSKHQFEYRTCYPTQWIPTGCSFFFWRINPQWARASSFKKFLVHTQRRTTVSRTPLDEWLARRKDLYQTTYDTHNKQTSMLPVEFEPTISAGERLQTYALDRAAVGIGGCSLRHSIINQTRRWKAQQNLRF